LRIYCGILYKCTLGFILLSLPIFLENQLKIIGFHFLDPDIENIFLIIKLLVLILFITLGGKLLKPYFWPIKGSLQAIIVFFVLPIIPFMYLLIIILTLSTSTTIEVYKIDGRDIHIEKLSTVNNSSIRIYEACPFLYGYYSGKELDFISAGKIDNIIIKVDKLEYRIGKFESFPKNSKEKQIYNFNSTCIN